MYSFEVPDCNSALGQSSQDLKMHRLMVTAAKAVPYPDSIQEFLLVCEEGFQQTVSLIHFISCLDYKYCLPLSTEISRIPDAQP